MGFNRRVLFVLSAGLLAAASCQKSGQTGLPAESKIVVTRQPELAMEQLKIQSYGPLGLEWEMTAPRADGFTMKNKMHAQNIKIVFFQNGRKATDVTANEGILRFENKSEPSHPNSSETADQDFEKLNPGDMYLRGDVVAISTDGSKLTTDWLWFDKSEDLIFSTAPVKIDRDDSMTKGIGLKASSNLSSVKIFQETLTIKEKGKKK